MLINIQKFHRQFLFNEGKSKRKATKQCFNNNNSQQNFMKKIGKAQLVLVPIHYKRESSLVI